MQGAGKLGGAAGLRQNCYSAAMGASPVRVLVESGFVYPVMVVLMAVYASLPLRDALFLPVLLVLLPAVGVAQLPLGSVEALPSRRAIYAVSGASTLVLGLSALAVGASRDGLGFVGLRALAAAALAGWTAALTALGLAVIVASRLLAGRHGHRESALLRYLLPRGGREKGAFVMLCASAGFGEEMAFRGYAIPVLAEATGSVWGAVAISSIAFGIVHAYQGAVGVLRSGILGVLLALPLVVTGSLWPAILAHGAIDVIAGALLGRWLVDLGRRV